MRPGGMLLGWDNPDRHETVIATALGPGPTAHHAPTTFRPDNDWQQPQLDAIYERTDGIVTFVGDWHVHPSGGLGLSRRDRKTMALVARSSAARCPRPITVLLARTPEGHYRTGAWALAPRPWPLHSRVAIALDLSIWTTRADERFWE